MITNYVQDKGPGRLHPGPENVKITHKLRIRKTLTVLAFMAPIIIFAVLFVYYPFIKTVINSLSSVNDKGEILRFVGFENYRYVFGRSDFAKALKNSLLITAINVH